MFLTGQVPSPQQAIASVLRQPECLELVLVINRALSAGLERLDFLPLGDSRLRLLEVNYLVEPDASSAVFTALRGTFVCILHDYDVCLFGSLKRAVNALTTHPDWLMVCGDREEIDSATGSVQRRLAFPGLLGFQIDSWDSELSWPAAVFRRSLPLLLGFINASPFKLLDPEFFHTAFATFPRRIGYLPHLQFRSSLHHPSLDDKSRRRLALDAASWFRESLNHDLPADPPELVSEHQSADLNFLRFLPLRLLQADHPELLLDALSPPCSPHLRLQQAVFHFSSAYPLLKGASAPAELVPFAERPFGVNLVGHAYEVFGIGEDIRMAASALQAAGVPCAVIYHPAANGSACTDHSLEPLLCTDPSGGPFAFNLICMAAASHARWLLQGGLDALRERYTLTAWPWESQQWPKAWLPLLEVADELWPSSSFTAAGLQMPAAAASLPLQVMPMAAAIPDPERFCSPAARRAARARHDLPADDVLFGYSFDLNSTAIRKNPMGALEAFQLAFPSPEVPASFGREIKSHPLSNQVSLMIKSFPLHGPSPEWHWLQLRAAEDPRIHLVAASLERDELLALYGCCDVYLSLHRSEGFGRGMAEALQLGLDVISTAYGGNTDFCTGSLAHPVRFQTVPIPRGAYPCADGHHWAEPDLEHAAALMQEVAARRRSLDLDPATASVDPSRSADVLAAYRERFSYENAGMRYRERLEELWSMRHALATQLKWKLDTPV
jgi:glycosyltransferase involved in cell wall biosynthesis